MTKIFIIDGAHPFGHSGGRFNATLTSWTEDFFTHREGFAVQTTHIREAYDPELEVQKFVWADVVIYHTPVWWFQLPHDFKKYIDVVFTAGHKKGIYTSDGRSRKQPEINYGKGGELHGRKYMLTTSWNAPATAFTLPGEFFMEKSVDDAVMFGFHRMNAFTGMEPLKSFHFHDMEKNVTPEGIAAYKAAYEAHLAVLFPAYRREIAFGR